MCHFLAGLEILIIKLEISFIGVIILIKFFILLISIIRL
jgi:hypothetical protein